MSTPHPGTELDGCIWWLVERRGKARDGLHSPKIAQENKLQNISIAGARIFEDFFWSLLGGFLGMQEFGGAKSCRMHRSLLNTNIHWVRTMDGWMWGSMSSEVEFKLISFRLANIGGMI